VAAILRRLGSLEIVDLAARLLGPFCDEVVFVGGAILVFLISEPAARRPRTTDDADVIVEARTKLEYQAIERKLRELGFQHDQFGLICRFLHSGLSLNVMPVNEEVLGFSNQWHHMCLNDTKSKITPEGRAVRVISSPCFLACKMDAFRSLGRNGAGDPLASRDFEDVISVLDGCSELEAEMQTCPPEIKSYLAAQARLLVAEREIAFSVECCLDPDIYSQSRCGYIMARLKWIASLTE